MSKELTAEEMNELFEGCHSNIDAPLIGRMHFPPCTHCKNFIIPDDWLLPFSCSVYGELPEEIYYADGASCAYHIEK